jgi:predicted anti-sigma-YlaC factor YlaD
MKTPGELTCMELTELVTAYLEGALAPVECARFEEHLAVCPGCSAYLDQMRKTIRLAGMLKEDDIAPEARDQLLQAFRSWKQG